MKRLLSFAALFLCSLLTFAQFSGSGSGTESDPYLIYNENQLAQLSNFLGQSGVVFKLQKDLDISNYISENNPSQGWIPVGVESSPFMGVFYGNGHKITGFYINRPSTVFVGFWGSINGAKIQDLTIEGTYVKGGAKVGGITGYATGSTISNCKLTLSSEGTRGSYCTGGIVGLAENSVTINACTYNGNVNGINNTAIGTNGDRIGGIAGSISNGTVNNCIVNGTVTGERAASGGVSGYIDTSTISNSSITGNVNGKSNVGGIVGVVCGTSNVSNVTSIGDVKGTENVSGVAAELREGSSLTLSKAFHKGKITNTGDYTGGIVAKSNGGCIKGITNCSHFGDINANNYVGGIVGAVLNNQERPTYYASTSSTSMTGGSLFSNTTIEDDETVSNVDNCTAIGKIYGKNNIGGLIGKDEMSCSYVLKTLTGGSVTISHAYFGYNLWRNNTYIGSFNLYDHIAPIDTRTITNMSIVNSYYSGIITGTANVGGVAGYKNGGSITNCYANATIIGESNVGGVIGTSLGLTVSGAECKYLTLNSNVAICQSISASNSNIGRIYGNKSNDYVTIGALGSKESNRALSQTSVILCGVAQDVTDNLQNGTSVGPSMLKLKANYVSWGWDFDTNWNILETECYPYKKYQAAPPVIGSELVSQATEISGSSLDGGTVYLFYKDNDVQSTTCTGNSWSFTTEALQSGARVQLYAEKDGLTPSYLTSAIVKYPGSGTEEDPYRIYTAADLQGASNSGYYKLMNDIDLTSWINENSPTEGWPAIGRNSTDATYIDGEGHTVSGLWTNTTKDYNGLFSNYSAGYIKNLNVKVANGKKVKGGDYTGVLIGRMYNGEIINCTIEGDVDGTLHVGGVAGYAEKATMKNNSYDGNVSSSSGNAFVGGISGHAMNVTTTSCTAKVTLTSSGANSMVGGIYGKSESGSITKCHCDVNITAGGKNCNVGGLIGNSITPVTLCYTEGNVKASGDDSYTGGLIGYAKSSVVNSYSIAATTGTLYTAGLVGYTFNMIDKCFAKGDVNGVMYGAGVVGELDGASASITNSVAFNNILALTAQSSWGCRVIGGYKNGCAEPNNSNYALNTMQVSLNGVPQVKTDDNIEGISKTADELLDKATYEGIGWDFTNVWKMEEDSSYPYLDIDEGGSDDPSDDPDPVVTTSDVLCVDNITTMAGKTTTVEVNLKNITTDYTGYQFDIILPEGFSVALNPRGKLDYAKGDRYEDDSQQLSMESLGNNTYRVLSFSMSNGLIEGNDGAILTFKLQASENIEEGDYTASLKDIVFTELDGTQCEMADTTFNITINNVIKGDVNGDTKVNVSDIVEIVNYILGKPSERFNMIAADVSEDNTVNVTDIVRIVNMIMSTNNTSNVPRAIGHINSDITINGTDVRLDNTSSYTAAQFDILLNEGQKIEDIALNITSDHVMVWQMVNDKACRVIIYSMSNSPLESYGNNLLSISITGDSTSANIGNVVLVPTDSQTTGIEITSDDNRTDTWYSIEGRRMSHKPTQKGLYIHNNKIYIVK